MGLVLEKWIVVRLLLGLKAKIRHPLERRLRCSGFVIAMQWVCEVCVLHRL
jgi:hypothetical protein